jgi:hypothetical protein
MASKAPVATSVARKLGPLADKNEVFGTMALYLDDKTFDSGDFRIQSATMGQGFLHERRDKGRLHMTLPMPAM